MAEVRVGIVMGSDSDLKVMEDAVKALRELGVGWELRVISAHRDPAGLHEWIGGLAARGIRVIIAAAGGAAHLPGVCASLTTLPVIGVPILASALGGADALYSIVQMPPGVPVATVGVNAARNAGILAVQVLALADRALAERLVRFKQELTAQSRGKDAKAQAIVADWQGEAS